MIKSKKFTKGFLAILLATVIPTFIMFIVFSMQYGADLPLISGIWGTLFVAAAAIMVYGIFVAFIGVKKIYK
ncbi:MAG: hypothetical protein ACTSQB_04550 [Candidatus Heimdallarchaeota archaeon]